MTVWQIPRESYSLVFLRNTIRELKLWWRQSNLSGRKTCFHESPTSRNENPEHSLITLCHPSPQNGSHHHRPSVRLFFCPHTGATTGGTWARDFSRRSWRRTWSGHLNPLKQHPVLSFLTESHSVIVIKQSWWDTWSLWCRSLPSQREHICYGQTSRKYTDQKNRCAEATSGPFEAVSPSPPPLLQRKVSSPLQTSGWTHLSFQYIGWNWRQLAIFSFPGISSTTWPIHSGPRSLF